LESIVKCLGCLFNGHDYTPCRSTSLMPPKQVVTWSIGMMSA
jgi:hypothetical protein